MTELFRSQRLDPARHDVAPFTCGEPSLDEWLRDHAATATARGTARTWVWIDGSGAVVAYYALSAHKVARDQVPSRVGRGGPVEIPAILIGRLALAVQLRGQDLGVELVADALERIVAVSQVVGARLVVVDALKEGVAQFYEELGFRRVPGSLLLVQRIDDIAAAT